jgi:hypothetical protein
MACKLVLLKAHRRSEETVQTLRYLLEEAVAGRVTGMAFVAIHAGQDYSTGIVGHAKAIPTLTRGMVKMLDDEVAALLYPIRTIP